MKRIAVTGGAGFLGGHLVASAARRGHDVLSLVRETRSAPLPKVRVEKVDHILVDPAELGGTDVLVHAAAVRHRHGASASDYRASNVDLVEAIVRAAAGRVGRFVHISSVGVYGFPDRLPVSETSPFAPATLYSATKIEAERIVRRLGKELGLPFTIIRPTIIYGPGDSNGMLDKLTTMLRARRYLVVGDGRNTLHHTFIDDIVDGIFTLAESEAGRNDDFIVAGPETTTLRDLSALVAKHVGTTLPPVHFPLPLARGVASLVDLAAYRGWAFAKREPPINNEKLDVMTRSISFSAEKAARAGFRARVGYAEGVARTLSHR